MQNVATLHARIAELEVENAALQNELVYRGVKLSCSKVALARATIAFDEARAALHEAQARLAHDQKMAGIGQLAAGVAHELNSPAGAVVSAQDTLGRGVERLREVLEREGLPARVPALPRLLGVIQASARVLEEGTQRMNDTVKRLAAFTALDRATQQPVDVVTCLQGTLELMEHQIPQGVALERCFVQVPRVQAEARALNDVFANLISNALRAIGTDGRLGIATGTLEGHVCVTIEDTGVGMEPWQLERLFDFDFSEQCGRIGASMGLPLCARIVQEHGGEIRVDSTPGAGSTLRVLLPALAA